MTLVISVENYMLLHTRGSILISCGTSGPGILSQVRAPTAQCSGSGMASTLSLKQIVLLYLPPPL